MRRLLTLGGVVAACALGLLVTPPRAAAAQPQPTLVLSPSSGPCDATVKANGTGFAVGNLGLYLLRPGTTDVNMGILNAAVVHPEDKGDFSQWVPLRDHGCEAATLDSGAEQRAGYLTIAAAPGGGRCAAGAAHPQHHGCG